MYGKCAYTFNGHSSLKAYFTCAHSFIISIPKEDILNLQILAENGFPRQALLATHLSEDLQDKENKHRISNHEERSAGGRPDPEKMRC